MDNNIFDYNKAAAKEGIPEDVLSQFFKEAQEEFPFDEMMRELHILRTINAYASEKKRVAC